MNISIIVAVANNGVIGRNGRLPWHLSADFKHFKEVTMGKPLIMGRKTHESLGIALPGRKNIIVTRSKNFTAQGCTVVQSLDQALLEAGEADEMMVIGGSSVYEQLLPRTNRIYLTEVNADLEGDVYFPEFDRNAWREIGRKTHLADENNDFDCSLVILERSI